jgi:hypothetical protein
VFSLAAVRYRSVLAADGGPVECIEEGELEIFGRMFFQANVRLKDALVPRRTMQVYADADGTGMATSPMIARHIAISEALERWAHYDTFRSAQRAVFGFHLDRSSSGMAAFPGFSRSPARRAARFEAIERFCLLNWWERRLDGETRETEWPDVTAVSFDAVAGGNAVILFKRSEWGFYTYGHAAADSFEGACEHAMMELVRHEWAIHGWLTSNNTKPPEHTFERRAWFFSTDEGHELFNRRLGARVESSPPNTEVVCDSEIRGPWSAYATVWRFLFRPPSERFMADEGNFFFWCVPPILFLQVLGSHLT